MVILMEKIVKKSVLLMALFALMPALSACHTTSNERIMYGTIIGAGIGAGIGAVGGGSALPGAAAGAFVGATVATLTE